MPTTWVEPEVAFEIRVQRTREQIEGHCALSPDNDLRDFDNMGGLNIEVYHVYKDQNLYNKMTYWYTTDSTEDCEFEFDIRLIPNHPIGHQEALQQAIDSGLFHFDGDKLSTRCPEWAKDYRDKCKEARAWMKEKRRTDSVRPL